MRNFAVHESWGIETRTIWKTIRDDLPPLLPNLNQVIDSERDEAESEQIILAAFYTYKQFEIVLSFTTVI
jgi:hypothetical protein